MTMLHGFGEQLLLGAAGTLRLAAAALGIGCLLGFIGCALQLSRRGLLRASGHAYVAGIRGVPDLLVVFAVYFGGSWVLGVVSGGRMEVNAFFAGTIALGLSFGAYAAEIARGGLASVPTGQREAARVLGLSRARALGCVVLPQAARAALAPLGNQTIVLLKQTSIVSIVGCDELMRKAAEAAGATREPFTMFLAAALIYLALTGLLATGLAWADNRLAHPGTR